TTIAASVLILLLSNPFMLFDIGFQLSYGATLGIIFFYNFIKSFFKRMRIPNGIIEVLAATISAQIGVLPISAYYFNRISIISLLSNLLVVPMTELITIMGFIMVFLSPIIFIAKIISVSNLLLLSAILKITEISAGLPYAAINVPTPKIWQVVLFYAFTLY
ncbi:ComEC/Rec2 family competence protein, partial [Cutibacterium acnes]